MSEKFRDFLKDSIRKMIDSSTTDQSRGIKAPPAEKPCNPEEKRTGNGSIALFEIIGTDSYLY